jgi:predicted Zn-dependent protease
MDGLNAEVRVARVSLEGEVLVVATDSDGVVARFPIRDLRIDAMHEGGVFHVECSASPDALLTLDDSLLVSTLRARGAKVAGLSGGSRGLAIGVASAIVLAALMGAAYFGAPRVAYAVARRVPIATERDLAPQMEVLFARNTCKSDKASAAIRRMVERLDPEHSEQVDVRVVNLRIANAFALPGGVVLLTRDLLEEAGGPDEVAGVLAHELAHVQHRDALSHMIRNALLGGLWAATLGDYSGLMIVDPKTAYETATLKFSREAEAAADDEALRRLTRQGISTKGMIEFFERNEKKASTEMTWLSSHPASADRIEKLSHQVLAEKGAPALDPESFYDLRKACESTPQAHSVRDLLW